MDTLASPHCYGCNGSGKIDGFGMSGERCMCVAECESCCEPFAWGHDDQYPPRECPSCRVTEAVRRAS